MVTCLETNATFNFLVSLIQINVFADTRNTTSLKMHYSPHSKSACVQFNKINIYFHV